MLAIVFFCFFQKSEKGKGEKCEIYRERYHVYDGEDIRWSKTLMFGGLNLPTKSFSTPDLQLVGQVEVKIAGEARV